jgi:hypothetical protein
MREIVTITKAYKFEELSDKAKDNAVSELYDVNVIDSFWYEHIVDQLKTETGITIEGFDLYREGSIDVIIGQNIETLRNLKKHMPRLYKELKEYSLTLSDLRDFLKGYSHDYEMDVHRAISGEILALLRREYDYLTSEEAIIETIEANEYEFTEEGKLI